MCINTSMSIVEKVFHYEENEISVIKSKGEIWFKAIAVAIILKYKNTMKSIRDHVDPEDKRKLSELRPKSKQNESFPLKSKQNRSFWLKMASESRGSKTEPLKRNEGNTIYINELGLYSLILQSKLESAKAFKRWVTQDVLKSIRKTGRFDYCINHKYNNMLTFKIENETDLHVKVVSFLKKRYPHSLFTVTLGENQCTSIKRIKSHKKGYLRGSPDLIINNLHKHYTGFCIECKSPKGNGVLSPDQSIMLRQYQNNGFKTLVSNDYDHIIEQLIEYFRDVRILCSHCPRRFISSQSLRNYIKSFYKM